MNLNNTNFDYLNQSNIDRINNDSTKEDKLTEKNNETLISDSEAISIFKSVYAQEYDTAKSDYTKARENEGWIAKAGDSFLGLFGCNTIEDMDKKIIETELNVNKLANSQSKEEFKKNYKDIFGVDFDKNLLAARQQAVDKFNTAQAYQNTAALSHELIENTNSYSDLKTNLQNKFNYDEDTINQIIDNYAKQDNITVKNDEDKKNVLIKFLNETKDNSEKEFKNITEGKNLEQLANEVELLNKRVFGENNILNDVTKFNENQELTDLAGELGVEIAATLALQLVPGIGQFAAARLALKAEKLGAIGLKIANYANKSQKVFQTANDIQTGNTIKNNSSLASTVINQGAKAGSQVAAAGIATVSVDLSNKKSVEEATKKALMNMSFTSVGAASNLLAPKLMQTFGFADKKIATDIAEQIINIAGIYGIMKFNGNDYGKEHALIDFSAGLILSRLAHIAPKSVKQETQTSHVIADIKPVENISNETKNTGFEFNLQRFAYERPKIYTLEEKENMLISLNKDITDFDKPEILNLSEEQFIDFYQMLENGLDPIQIRIYKDLNYKEQLMYNALFDLGMKRDMEKVIPEVVKSRDKFITLKKIINSPIVQDGLKSDNIDYCRYLSGIARFSLHDTNKCNVLADLLNNKTVGELIKNRKVDIDYFTGFKSNQLQKINQLVKYENFCLMMKNGSKNNVSYISSINNLICYTGENLDNFKKILANPDFKYLFENKEISEYDISKIFNQLNNTQIENLAKVLNNKEIQKLDEHYNFSASELSKMADINDLSGVNAEKLLSNSRLIKELGINHNIIKYQNKLNYDKFFELVDESYSVQIVELQNGAGAQLIAFKDEFVPEEISQIIKMDTNGNITKSITQKTGNDFETIYSNSNKLVNVKKAENEYDVASQIEIVMNDKGETEYVLHTKESDQLQGAFETVQYNPKDYPKNFDIVKAIQDGSISGGKNLSRIISKNGITNYRENYTYNGNNIQRNYTQKLDEHGKINSYEYRYNITDKDNNNLLSLERSLKINDDGTTTTAINGKTYTAKYDDTSMTITLTSYDGTVTNIDIKSKIADLSEYKEDYWNNEKKYVIDKFGTEENMHKALFDFLKTLPADQLLTLNSSINKIKVVETTDSGVNIEPNINNFPLNTGLNVAVISHELGHVIDFRSGEQTATISGNKELIEIYNKEIDAFNKEFTEPQQEVIDYFSQTGGSSHTGLSELVAETNMLITTYGNNFEYAKSRAQYLVKYFPQTVAKIAELLEYK